MNTDWQKYIGHRETRIDRVGATAAALLAATLDHVDPAVKDGERLPPLWHWICFPPIHRASEIGPDGHVRRGGFLPPVPLPRRMWAGGRIAFRAPLVVGETVSRESRIVDIQERQGRSGPLVFVVVRHTISNAGGIAIVDEQDIVFREAPRTDASTSHAVNAPVEAAWSREIHPDPCLLFRYSALTFNGHRIHYDRRYATEVEGYPGIVVHGPLIATLLMDLLHHALPKARVTDFSYRAVSPLFDTGPFFVRGQPSQDGVTVHLWAQTTQGVLAMDATATVS